MKKYKIYVTEEELVKIKNIIPSIDFQLTKQTYKRCARAEEWRQNNKKRYLEYQKQYREKRRKEKEKNEHRTKKK